MNLIEKLGIEKCRAIVDGAPEWASHYVPDRDKTICCHNEDHFYFRDQVKLGVEHIRLNDLRTAIMNHGTPTDEGTRNTDNLSHLTDNFTHLENHISPNTKVIER